MKLLEDLRRHILSISPYQKSREGEKLLIRCEAALNCLNNALCKWRSSMQVLGDAEIEELDTEAAQRVREDSVALVHATELELISVFTALKEER